MKQISLVYSLCFMIFIVTLTACGSAGDSNIQVKNVWVRPISIETDHTMENMSHNDIPTAAYMTIVNTGSGADRLVSVSTDAAARVEIHRTTIDNQGMAHMQLQENGVEIPANGSIEIKVGSYHIMLTDLNHSLVVGETVEMSLAFASGKSISVQAQISEFPPEE